jgi:glycosyltransferase involved in cell wall biosynthesis
MRQAIYVNGRFLSQNFAGVQRFSREITRALLAEGLALQVLAPCNAKPDGLEDAVQIVGQRIGYAWEQYELPRYLRGIGAPLLLNFGNMAPLTYLNQVVTLHDVAYLLHPKSYRFGIRHAYRWFMPRIVRQARAVVTVSAFSKAEINKFYRIDPGRITVVYNAADNRFSDSRLERRADTFLALAAGGAQKNHHSF